MNTALLNPRLFNPLHWHLMPLLRDESIRYIYVEGGSSAAKTAEICSSLLIDQAENNYSSLVFRRFHVHIRDSVFNSTKTAASRLEFTGVVYTFHQDMARCLLNTAKIGFRGLDNEETLKGIEDYDIVYNNEWNQFSKDQWDQQRKRLRGRRNQKFICDWNPVSAKLWLYEEWLDLDEWIDLPLDIDAPTQYSYLDHDFAFKKINKKGNSVWIKVTYRDNFWVRGHPSGQGGFLDQHTLDDYEYDREHNFNLYRVYANGERGIIRTGGEYFKQFNEVVHVKPLKVERTTVHISFDENVMPYVTIGCWQVIGKQIRQVHEIPCKPPNNNAPKAAQQLVNWLHLIEYNDVVFIYGDPSSSKRSSIDPNNSSFYDKVIEVLMKAGFKVANRVGRSAPEVALRAAFINAIYENNLYGYSITISDKCKVSIDDYSTVKEDMDGSMLKIKVKDPVTQQTYEPHGHYADQKCYFIVQLLQKEWLLYKQRIKPRPVGGFFH